MSRSRTATLLEAKASGLLISWAMPAARVPSDGQLLGVDELALRLLELLVDLAEPLVGGGQLLGPPPQLLLGLDAVGDVLEVAADVVDRAVRVVARLGVDPHVVPLAGLGVDPQDEVVPLADLAGLAELVLGQGAIVGVEELQERPLAEHIDACSRGTPARRRWR